MWSKSYSIVTKEATKEQLWTLLADVNNWHTWDEGIEYAKMDSPFEEGNYFILKPQKAPKVKIQLVEVIKNKTFTDLTRFPLAKMWGKHTFDETPDGLKIMTTMSVKGLLSFLWIKLVAQDIVNALPLEMANQVKIASKL